MIDPNVVTLTVGDHDYAGWKSVEISAGIERQARSFEVSITWQWPGTEVAHPIMPGAACEVRIGGELILTGWVFAAPINYDGKQVTLKISGRSKTADLIDCAAINKPSQWKDVGVLTIVQALAAPYALSVISEIPETSKMADHTIEPAESVFKSIDRLLTLFRIFSTDDEFGNVVLARPGSRGQSADALELGKNVLSAIIARDFSGLFSEYRVIGQQTGNDKTFGKEAAEVSAVVTDDRNKERLRVLILHEDAPITPKLALSRANWERGQRAGKALLTTYKVQGWRQSNGALWRHNTMVQVVDPVIGLGRNMLISAVTYSLSDLGTITTLLVGPPEGFQAEPGDPNKRSKVQLNQDAYSWLLPIDEETTA
ncbi:Bacteriophage Mu P [Pseudomonas syringae pv. delphinii]|uniref:Bacteriophage Mu P n=1 Tax=Pseudomonas syringae pv. delphinii TaxID=192088 RepID=A0A0P9QDY4_9PSED|nr:baseplate protein [Pseudomonas syringae group genomosp. 3]KPX22609.1 Bacteriophage Mu P [Pseudomonas syringae pv. delphinii]RMP06850.1 Bacteriophage Mu P [Pseudomonas syringae pv. delphinii]RMP27807.1 Bacteriophage Mu P [Pseudomonas syringae pv. delphinii]RMQ26602.1 Bacteriophage Mu P [Pseudomonas syringae pv. delphinii]